MSTFVLVHGSWHDGSSWSQVIKHLERNGHTAFGPTIAGHGKGVDKQVTHAQSVQSIVDFIVDHELTDFVLLGHSYGGTIVCKVAEVIPDRIRRLIFWNAFILQDGERLYDVVPPPYRGLFDQLAASSPDNTITLPFPIWREAFINDADLELAQQAYEQLSSEPYGPVMEPLDLKQFYTLQIPRSFLNGTEDTALPPGEWGWHPRLSSRLGLYRLVQMPGSHELLFSNPRLLAEKIIEAGRD
ncbi:MAG: alpha/beta fold hydrolase [Chloroflexi bacterium]|nr:alpha/beta fold hydrolase [Chloroflexota bacterium]